MDRKNIRIAVAVLCLWGAAVAAQAMAPDSTKRVLVLNSYHETYHWSDRVLDGIKSVLGPLNDVELYIEYMDTKRISDEQHFQNLRSLYAHKYQHVRFDAIISTDDNALNFLLNFRHALFAGVPVFFSGITDFQPERLAGKTRFTGVSETYDVAGTIELMLQLHPQTRTIFAITDNTVTGLAFREQIKRAAPQFAERLQIEYLHDATPENLCGRLRELPSDALVLWAIYLRTPAGAFISSEDSVGMTVRASTVPVYCLWDVVGHGVVGGKITCPHYQGEAPAEMAVRFLQDGYMEDLQAQPSPLIYKFDYEVLQEFGIPELSLPEGSVLFNKPYSIYGQYKEIIWATIGMLLLMLLIIVLLVHYILLRRKAERTLALAREQLEQSRKLEAVGQLSGRLAHDFNNILASIGSVAEVLEMDAKEEDRKYIEMILSLSDRASRLTDKLLAFGRKGNLELEPTDLHLTIDNAVEILTSSVNENIAVEAQFNAPDSMVMADDTQLTNALLNMGLNAERAMPQGGKILFKTSVVTLGARECKDSGFELSPGRFFCLEVCDTGSGIKPEHVKKIFEPFFTTHEPGKGTGLGLASVYGSIVEYKGAISVQSELGKGTEFKILLPLMEESDTPQPPEPLEQVCGDGQLILVADDESIVRNTTSKILTDLNYRVISASNGREVVDLFKEHSGEIDLVIMDVVMPEMSGRKACERIREMNADTKIIFTSGFTGRDAVGAVAAQPGTAFLKKPFRAKDLNQLIASLLGKSK